MNDPFLVRRDNDFAVAFAKMCGKRRVFDTTLGLVDADIAPTPAPSTKCRESDFHDVLLQMGFTAVLTAGTCRSTAQSSLPYRIRESGIQSAGIARMVGVYAEPWIPDP